MSRSRFSKIEMHSCSSFLYDFEMKRFQLSLIEHFRIEEKCSENVAKVLLSNTSGMMYLNRTTDDLFVLNFASISQRIVLEIHIRDSTTSRRMITTVSVVSRPKSHNALRLLTSPIYEHAIRNLFCFVTYACHRTIRVAFIAKSLYPTY